MRAFFLFSLLPVTDAVQPAAHPSLHAAMMDVSDDFLSDDSTFRFRRTAVGNEGLQESREVSSIGGVGVDGPTCWDTTNGFPWADGGSRGLPKRGIQGVQDICGDLGANLVGKVAETTEKPDMLIYVEGMKGYKITDKDGDINVIGERMTPLGGKCQRMDISCWQNQITNRFQDKLHLIWKCGNKWRHYTTKWTTLPGFGFKGQSLTSIMSPGQYIKVYCKASHKGTPAMRHSGPVNQYLLQKDGTKFYIRESNGKLTLNNKNSALNFHGTASKKSGQVYDYDDKASGVNTWSLGCQVTPGSKFGAQVLPLLEGMWSKGNGDYKGGKYCYSNLADCNKCVTYTLVVTKNLGETPLPPSPPSPGGSAPNLGDAGSPCKPGKSDHDGICGLPTKCTTKTESGRCNHGSDNICCWDKADAKEQDDDTSAPKQSNNAPKNPTSDKSEGDTTTQSTCDDLGGKCENARSFWNHGPEKKGCDDAKHIKIFHLCPSTKICCAPRAELISKIKNGGLSVEILRSD